MDKKVVYVMEHYSKEVRKSIVELAVQEVDTMKSVGEGKRISTLKRKKVRVWTLNRSPHGNKTAREQFGRQVWQRRRERKSESGLESRKKIVYGKNQYVKRKEIQKTVVVA